MENKNFIIAIDGVAASGKGTLSMSLAKKYNFAHLDTGKMYRLLADSVIKEKVDSNDENKILKLINDLDFTDVHGLALHTDEISECASKIATHKNIREKLNVLQRKFPQKYKGIIMDGRDIGTVIFPNADIKLFITATLEERAKRRFKQLQVENKTVIYEAVLEDLRERDNRDITRLVAPSIAALDAIIIDTTNLNAKSVLDLAIILTQNAVDEFMKTHH